MSFLPDPAELDAIAARIARQGLLTRTSAAGLGATVAALDWQGFAADAFRGQSTLVLGGLRGAAGRLDGAADALRRHARSVGSVLGALAGVGVDGVHALEDVARDPRALVGDGRRLLGDAGCALAGVGHVLGLP